jgi:hypothetical protein
VKRDNHGRLLRYVRRYFVKHRSERFPTVREVARALRLPQVAIEELAGEEPLMLTLYNTDPEPSLGDHFVEILE